LYNLYKRRMCKIRKWGRSNKCGRTCRESRFLATSRVC